MSERRIVSGREYAAARQAARAAEVGPISRAFKVVTASLRSMYGGNSIHYEVGASVSAPGGMWAYLDLEMAVHRWANSAGTGSVIELTFAPSDVIVQPDAFQGVLRVSRATVRREFSRGELLRTVAEFPAKSAWEHRLLEGETPE